MNTLETDYPKIQISEDKITDKNLIKKINKGISEAKAGLSIPIDEAIIGIRKELNL